MASYTSPRQAPSRQTYRAHTVVGEGIIEVPVGPIHAGIIEPGHFRFSTSGERVLHLDARLFYTHRGIEKHLEGVPVQRAISEVEATCGVCSVSHAVAFSRACERLANCHVPERAERWRAILLEMERLYNHVGDVGNICAGVGLAFGVQRGAALKERLMQLNEELTGHRFLRNVVMPGGLRHDLEVGRMQTVVAEVTREFNELVEQLWDEATLLDRLKTTGKLSPHQARALGVVGPAARASGVSGDWRVYHPQPGYEGLAVRECLRETTDVEARMLLRVDEVAESTRLIEELCACLQSGAVNAPLGDMATSRPALGYCESPRGAMVHWLMAADQNTIYRLHIRSAAFANWPAVPLTVPGNIVPDFPLINKSFELCYACCDR
jgi:Ni,Fe-hydrogenase III large subunit